MTNYQHWQNFTAELESPDIFLDLSLYWAVGTALERRIHYGATGRKHFCNPFTLLVGPPAVGKGTAMRAATSLLEAYYFEDENGRRRKDPITMQDELLFLRLPDTLTFERMIELIYKTPDRVIITGPKTAEGGKGFYFSLEELSSLLKKNKTEDVGRFLINGYDGEAFRYSTRHHGDFTIKNYNIAFIAGTQVDFIRKLEAEGLAGEGLLSRFLIAYAREPRKRIFDYPPLTDDQKASQKHLREWIKNLAKLRGTISQSPEVAEWTQSWYEQEAQHLSQYADGKLSNYFARRKDQVKRLAAAIHFLESIDLSIPIAAFQEAARFLRLLESSVIRLVNQTGRNALYPIAERLVSDIKAAGVNGRTRAMVMGFLLPEMDFQEAEKTLQMLTEAKRITFDGTTYKAT